MTTTPARFTRADYLKLPEGFPAQLVEGQLRKKPTPPLAHQIVAGRLLFHMADRLGVESLLPGPIDVFIDDENVYQPDLVVFAEPRHWSPEDTDVGTPDIVIEVLSNGTAALDGTVKPRHYFEKGVREVWLVDPATLMIEVRTPAGGVTTGPGGVAESTAVAGLAIDLARLFRT